MQRLTLIHKRESSRYYIHLLSLYIRAQKYVDKKIRHTPKEELKWQQIQRCLHMIKFFIDCEEIPNEKQKKRLSFTLILGKEINEVAEYAVLQDLELAFNELE